MIIHLLKLCPRTHCSTHHHAEKMHQLVPPSVELMIICSKNNQVLVKCRQPQLQPCWKERPHTPVCHQLGGITLAPSDLSIPAWAVVNTSPGIFSGKLCGRLSSEIAMMGSNISGSHTDHTPV